jgi:hypothetical protein
MSGRDRYRFKTCFSFSSIHTSLHFYHVMLCVFLMYFSRDFGILCTFSHPMIFIVSSIILLSFYAFRILEYLLGYFLEIVCIKILFCLCVELIYLGNLDCDLCFCNTFGIHLTAVLNTTLFLELTGSNGIFGDISGWFWFRNMKSSGSQHNV